VAQQRAMPVIGYLSGRSAESDVSMLVAFRRHELVPNAKSIAMLWNPSNSPTGVPLRDAREATAKLGLQLNVLNTSTDSELDAVFGTLSRQRADAMIVITSPFIITRAKQVDALAAHLGVPAIYSRREFADAGGLMS
jgi:putative tryptophan/tyrosine transport system substrate-binding protein